MSNFAECTKRSRQVPFDSVPLKRRTQEIMSNDEFIGLGCRGDSFDLSSGIRHAAPAAQSTYVNSSFRVTNSPSGRSSPQSSPQKVQWCAPQKRKTYAAMPETTPPDAKVLPLPMFLRSQFSSQSIAAREIKDLLRIL